MNEYGLSINPRSKWSQSTEAAKVSVRELEILILHSEGKSNEEIAEILDIKYQTGKEYAAHSEQETGCNNQWTSYDESYFGRSGQGQHTEQG
jgi:DNA-binding CsgD family transcriptional regulator